MDFVLILSCLNFALILFLFGAVFAHQLNFQKLFSITELKHARLNLLIQYLIVEELHRQQEHVSEHLLTLLDNVARTHVD